MNTFSWWVSLLATSVPWEAHTKYNTRSIMPTVRRNIFLSGSIICFVMDHYLKPNLQHVYTFNTPWKKMKKQPFRPTNIRHTYLISGLTNDSNNYKKYHKQETILPKRLTLKEIRSSCQLICKITNHMYKRHIQITDKPYTVTKQITFIQQYKMITFKLAG
jgi:hypothetical protein